MLLKCSHTSTVWTRGWTRCVPRRRQVWLTPMKTGGKALLTLRTVSPLSLCEKKSPKGMIVLEGCKVEGDT